jgi:hypothetical protein
MVIQHLADVNIEGHVARVLSLMRSEYWRDLWDHLDIRARTFRDAGLSRNDPDVRVWQICQQQQLYMVTNNRNDDGPDSLEATIRAFNVATSLPVFTLSDADRVFDSKDYAASVVESLFDRLMRIDTLHGTGRIYLP